MADFLEESNPLITKQVEEGEMEFKEGETSLENPRAAMKFPNPLQYGGEECIADGMPLTHGSVVGQPIRRDQWETDLFACLGRNDEFCSSDLEVCLNGSICPCLLYGSNTERLGSGPGTFSNHCLTYTGLYLIGNSFFGYNCLAPWFSYQTRTAIRHKFNLEGTCEGLTRSCGCCESLMEEDMQREQCESAWDFTAHVFCHPCALCQEGRELRRRLPHPAHAARHVLIMMPPTQQTMAYGQSYN